jgi:hypothetical protein
MTLIGCPGIAAQLIIQPETGLCLNRKPEKLEN